jgi:hypothetical protein
MHTKRILVNAIDMRCRAHKQASWCSLWLEVPQVRIDIHWIEATRQECIETEQMVLDALQSTLRQSVTPSSSRRRYADRDFAVRPLTQSMQGNGITVHRVAGRKPARKDTEERKLDNRARVQELPRRIAQGEKLPKRVDLCWGPWSTPSLPRGGLVHSRVRIQSGLPVEACNCKESRR